MTQGVFKVSQQDHMCTCTCIMYILVIYIIYFGGWLVGWLARRLLMIHPFALDPESESSIRSRRRLSNLTVQTSEAVDTTFFNLRHNVL
jgi:hypothetical protein